MNYQIYHYYINKITNYEKANYSPPLYQKKKKKKIIPFPLILKISK